MRRVLAVLFAGCAAAPVHTTTPEPDPQTNEVVVVATLGEDTITLLELRALLDRLARADAIPPTLDRLAQIYLAALAADPERQPNRFIDESVGPLMRSYEANPAHRSDILSLLIQFEDARILPILTPALEWQTDEQAEQTVVAARAMQHFTVPESERAEVVSKLATALQRVSGTRGLDNRLRIELIRALGATGDARATPALMTVALSHDQEQNFLINRLAVEAVSRIADPAAIDGLIRMLYFFAPNNPAMRANDVAANALVRIGRPAVAPLLDTLAGNNQQANEVATEYIAAVRAINADAANEMSVAGIVSADATYALGAIGLPEALEPLLEETRNADPFRRVNGAIALARVRVDNQARRRVREAMQRVYAAVPADQPHSRAQLLAALENLYDDEVLPFLLTQASDRSLELSVRSIAADSYALLAGRREAAQLRAMIASDPDPDAFRNLEPLLASANECDVDLPCWIDELDTEARTVEYIPVATKAAHMVGMLGRDLPLAISALVEHLDNPELRVRLAVLSALDRIAVAGSSDAVAKLERMQRREEGRAIWHQFAREALPVRARLEMRQR